MLQSLGTLAERLLGLAFAFAVAFAVVFAVVFALEFLLAASEVAGGFFECGFEIVGPGEELLPG